MMRWWWVVMAAGWALTGWAYVSHIRDAAHAQGYEQAMKEVRAVAEVAQAKNDAAHRAQIETLKEAQDARDKKLVVAQADAGRVRGELDRLRDEIARARTHDVPATSGDAKSCNATAERELQRILGEELERVSEAGARMAKQCDGHAADSVMLQDGWPK